VPLGGGSCYLAKGRSSVPGTAAALAQALVEGGSNFSLPDISRGCPQESAYDLLGDFPG
jgi:hypothetical protein